MSDLQYDCELEPPSPITAILSPNEVLCSLQDEGSLSPKVRPQGVSSMAATARHTNSSPIRPCPLEIRVGLDSCVEGPRIEGDGASTLNVSNDIPSHDATVL